MLTKINKNGFYKVLKSELSEEEINIIKRELYIKPYTYTKIKGNEFIIYQESNKYLFLPRYYGVNMFGEPNINLLEYGDDIEVEFLGKLRLAQKPVFDIFMQKKSGVICVPCGFGKTCIAISIISELKKRTIIIVHKEILLRQWEDRLKEFLSPNIKIGKVQGNCIDIDGKDIVICMLQSLSQKEYDKDIFEGFSFCITDETHHIGSKVFSRAMLKTGCQYNLGLSATPTRQDGCSNVIYHHIGPIIFQHKKRDDGYVEIHQINFKSDDEEYKKEILTFQKKISMAKMLNKVCENSLRTKFILDILYKTHLEENGKRKIMVLSDRIAHLEEINKLINEKVGAQVSGLYIGRLSEFELNESSKLPILCASYQIASEGLDIASLNTVLLASPRSNIEQSIGRCMRLEESKRIIFPKIIDICDNFSLFSNQIQKRRKLYIKNKYTIFIDGVKYEKKIKSNNKNMWEEECIL